MVKVGDKYKERMPFGEKRFFSWEYEVVGFTTESYGEFAKCIRKYRGGKEEPVSISIELLTETAFYKKVA